MVSVSCLEFVFCKSDVCVRFVVVFVFYGCLVNDRWLETSSVKWAFILFVAVACFLAIGAVCAGVGAFI